MRALIIDDKAIQESSLFMPRSSSLSWLSDAITIPLTDLLSPESVASLLTPKESSCPL